jgi:hypothetical protein
VAKIGTKPRKIIRASSAPESIGEQLQHYMSAIAALFDSPKLTLVIRSRSLEGDLIVSNDEAAEAIIAIKKFCHQHTLQEALPLN